MYLVYEKSMRRFPQKKRGVINACLVFWMEFEIKPFAKSVGRKIRIRNKNLTATHIL